MVIITESISRNPSRLRCGLCSSNKLKTERTFETVSEAEISRLNSQASNHEKVSINSSTVQSSTSTLKTLSDAILQTRMPSRSSVSSDQVIVIVFDK